MKRTVKVMKENRQIAKVERLIMFLIRRNTPNYAICQYKGRRYYVFHSETGYHLTTTSDRKLFDNCMIQLSGPAVD